MSFALVEKLTFLFLVGFFVFSEVYMARRRVWGIIERIEMPSLPFSDLSLKELDVRLDDGQMIKAQASPCAFCLGRYSPGDQVGVTKLGNKYHVCTSLISAGRKGSGRYPSGAREKERACLS